MKIFDHAPSASTVLRLAALIAVCSLDASGCKKNAAEAAAAPEKAAVTVQTEPAQVIEVPRVLRLTGTLRGDREADLAANAAGRVLQTSVERGEQIKPGQVLAKLDTRAASLSATEARAQAASTRAQEEQASAECRRYEELKAKGAISDQEYQERITQCRMLPFTLQAASARAALAAQNVGDGQIRAPFAGVVTERYVEVGQFVRQDTRVVSIVSVDPLRLEIAVPEAHVANVKQGAELTFSVATYPGRTFNGKVKFVSGALRPATRDLVVEAVVANPERVLLPGMFADVSLAVGTDRLPSVPERALRLQEEQERVFVVVDGRLEERIVQPGPRVGGRVSVKRGVKEREQVVVSELAELTNGQKVR